MTDQFPQTFTAVPHSDGESFFIREDLNGFTDLLGPYTAADLVLCQSGDGWSFHAPEALDFQIAEGNAAAITDGSGEPTEADRARAFTLFLVEPARYIA